jgi:hypothetical protein
MTEAERQRILDDSYETLDRLAEFKPREPSIETAPRGGAPAQPERPKRAEFELTEYEQARLTAGQWQAWVRNEVAVGARAGAEGAAEALGEIFDELREAIVRRDQRIERLESNLARTEAQVAKLEVRVIQGEVDRDNERRSLPLPPLRRDLN